MLVPKGFRKVEISMISLEACQSTHSILISYLKKGSVNKAKKSPNSILGKIRETIFQPLLSLPSEREVLSKTTPPTQHKWMKDESRI